MPKTTPGVCPRCKVERDLTVLIGGLYRCGWCTLLLRAHSPTSTVERIDRDQGEALESAR